MRNILLSILLLTLAACVHTGAWRKPAASDIPLKPPEPITCAETFAAVFNPEELQRTFDIGQRVMSEVRHFSESVYPEIVATFMLKASRLNDCANERAMASYQSDIAMKAGYFTARIQANNTTLAQSILPADKETAAKLACFSECAYKRTLTANPPNCQKKCALDPKLAAFYEDDLALKRLAMTCFQDVTDKNSHARRAEYQANYERAIPPFLEKLQKIKTALHGELTEDRRIYEQLSNMRAHFARFRDKRPKQTCGDPEFSWLQTATDASVFLRAKIPGTGFYLKAGDRRYLATAAHVSDPDLKLKTQVMIQQMLANGKQADGVRFELFPGLVSIPSDVILSRENATVPALDLVASSEIPQIEQKFYVAGFPTFAGGKFQILACTFYGFGPRLAAGYHSEGAYLLRCPGLGEVREISGGPMIDERGRVWGVVSSSERYTSTLRVTPLSVGRDGEPKIAIQQVFTSDLCYKSYEYFPHRCQVMPKMFSEDL